MDKVISVVQSENKSIQVASKTILDRYKTLADSAGGEPSPERLYKFLAGENGRVLSKQKADGSFDEQTLEECKVFAAYYTTRVSQKTRRKITERFGALPSFLRVGVAELSKSPQTFPWNCPLDLTDNQLRQMHSFVKYVEELDANRIAAIRVRHPNGGQDVKKSIALSRDMSSESMKAKRSLFLAYVGYMIQFGGRLNLRLCLPQEEFILMGFCAKNGKLYPITAEQMKTIYSGGPEEAKHNVEFKTPDWP